MVRQMFPAGYERAPLPPAQPEGERTAKVADRSPKPPTRTSGSEQGRGRDPFFDNAKYLTIVLVGLGHAWLPLRSDSRAAEALYYALYTFHMPAFIIISGYLSRSFEARPGQVKRLITGIAIPYLVFEIAFTFFIRAVENPDREFTLLNPGYALWFLVALFIWRLTAPVWNALRWPLPIALAIAAAATTCPGIGNDLNLQRVLQFLPFFVLGMRLRPEHFEMLRRRELKVAAVPIMAAALAFAYWAVPRMNKDWFLRDNAAQDLGVPWWVGVVMTLALFGCALLLTACFFAWVPTHRTWFTTLGAGTICAYLLHVYPIQLSRIYDWYAMPWVDSPTGRIIITVITAVMMTALCTPPVRRAFRWVMEPKLDWAFRRDPVDQARARARG
ncbi:acyltransferase family protein [Streptomyces alkaliterrae]|uniref:Acyltransferase family protein n=1 Tax=Streptomyces alkaliterrae TaxID=2213162 RepID=A0A5P0YRA1_9ACTN|nr:acyltransferase family protein [Streptomyces alkaliterrae]MQS01972.1 acyltransferase family protein [Streptomyces alkaliterrae]